MRLPFLDARRPSFPPPEQALDEPNGLLAIGGNLAPETLLTAYREGIFPWYSASQPILWWSPDPRAVLSPNAVHVSRSLARAIRRGGYEIRVDSAFARVVQACADAREHAGGTWIVPEMIDAYGDLHQQGHAHSVEYWLDEDLAGGLYGVAVGSVFCGESMFSHTDSASKIALVHLARGLAQGGFDLIDCQVETSHLRAMGATALPRNEFVEHLRRLATAKLEWPAALISARLDSNQLRSGGANDPGHQP